MKKNLLIRLLALLTIFILPACTQKNELRLIAEIANRQCPFRVDDGMTCTSITLEDDEFQYHIECDESLLTTEFIDVVKELKTSEEANLTSAYISEMSFDTEGRELLAKLRKNHIKVAYVYTGSITGKTVKLMVDINDTASAYPSPKWGDVKAIKEQVVVEPAEEEIAAEEGGSPAELLEMTARYANKSCPEPADEGMTMTAVKFANNAFIYEIECDEALLGPDCISNLREAKAELKADLINSNAEDYANIEEFIDLLIEGNAVVKYTYRGSISGESVSVLIKPSEIKSAAKARR